jgi:hypothetical protein
MFKPLLFSEAFKLDLRLVKTAPGRRLRHPDTKQVMSCADDSDSAPHKVDLDDPHWFRALQRGDIVEIKVSSANAAPPQEAPEVAAPVISAED